MYHIVPSVYLSVPQCRYLNVPHCTSLYLSVTQCASVKLTPLSVPQCTSVYLSVPNYHSVPHIYHLSLWPIPSFLLFCSFLKPRTPNMYPYRCQNGVNWVLGNILSVCLMNQERWAAGISEKLSFCICHTRHVTHVTFCDVCDGNFFAIYPDILSKYQGNTLWA